MNEIQPRISRRGSVTIFDGFLVEREALIAKLRASHAKVSLDLPDVDLVSACYETFGDATASELSGDFSFLVYDPGEGTVLGARDPFGRRALFYARCRNSWIFSNELPALLEHPECPDEYSPDAIGDFLMFGWHDLLEKSLTPFRAVRSVVPGAQVSVSGSLLRVRRYWTFPGTQPDDHQTRVHPVEELRFQLERAVRDRIDARNIVVSMSGGLDSTALAALAKQVGGSGAGGDIVLETNVHQGGGEEERFARLAGTHLGLPHRIRVHSLAPVFEPWPPTWTPHRQIAPVSILEHDRLLSQQTAVRLVGSAADSLLAHDVASFLGIARAYGLRAALTSRRELRRLSGISMSWGTGVLSTVRAWLRGRRPGQNPVWNFPSWLRPEFVRQHSSEERWRDFWNWEPRVSRSQPHPSVERWLGWPSWFCGNMFVGIDFCPSEVVDPFLDLGLLKVVMSVPSEPWLRDKWIFRKAVADLLPDAVVRRPKTIAGDVFRDPLAGISGGEVNDWAAEDDLDEYIDRGAVPRFVAESDPAERLVQLHPFFLNQWFRSRRLW